MLKLGRLNIWAEKLRQLLDQQNDDACTWGKGVDTGQNSTIQHVKHCLALLLRFLTLLLQNGAAKGRLQLIDHVRQEECGCAQTNSEVCRHPTGAHLNLNGHFSRGGFDLDHLSYVKLNSRHDKITNRPCECQHSIRSQAMAPPLGRFANVTTTRDRTIEMSRLARILAQLTYRSKLVKSANLSR